MDTSNVLYSNQGIHVISAIFTLENGVTKVLLIKRKNPPFKDYWILVGGACYNNEDILDAIKREILEKTKIENIYLEQFRAYGEPDRVPFIRMLAVGYIGVIGSKSVHQHIETRNTSDLAWFDIDKLPVLGFDHEKILSDALETLRKKIFESNILRVLFDDYFSLPQLQKTYEIILKKKFDRRNFRKKFLSLGLIKETNKEDNSGGGKPAKLYQFSNRQKSNQVFYF